MVEANKYKLEVGDKIKYKNIVYKLLEVKKGEYVVLNKPCDDCSFSKRMNYTERTYPMLFWEDLDYAVQKGEKEVMEQRLQELKEKITSFVRDYNIESFYVDIDDGISVEHITKPLKEVKVNLEIRV